MARRRSSISTCETLHFGDAGKERGGEKARTVAPLQIGGRAVIAELVYLFRHALLRDAAYQLQLPGDRARLHGLAFESLEALAGGRAPEPAALDSPAQPGMPLHESDPWAGELAEHARLAADGGDSPDFRSARRLYLRRAAEHSERRFRSEEAVRHWRELATLEAGGARGEALRRAAVIAHQSGRPRDAEPVLMEARELQRAGGHLRLEGAVLGSLAALYAQTGRTDTAEQTMQQALVLQRKSGDRAGEGVTLVNLAILQGGSGRVEQAERTYSQALALLREAGNRRIEGSALGGLALLLSEAGRGEQAELGFEGALAIHRETGNRRSEGVTLANLAVLYQKTGRLDLAEALIEKALDVHREAGNRLAEAIALGNVAILYQESGRIEKGEDCYDRALGVLRELGDRRAEGAVLGNLAGLFRQIRQFDLAEKAFLEALAIHRETGNRRFEGAQLCDYALCLVSMGRIPEAEEHWSDGARILEEVRDVIELERKRETMRAECGRAGVPVLGTPIS